VGASGLHGVSYAVQVDGDLSSGSVCGPAAFGGSGTRAEQQAAGSPFRPSPGVQQGLLLPSFDSAGELLAPEPPSGAARAAAAFAAPVCAVAGGGGEQQLVAAAAGLAGYEGRLRLVVFADGQALADVTLDKRDVAQDVVR
jgi:hypothetical protein